MSLWSERILGEFPPDLARFWIAADPDDVLLDEHILAELRSRGFEVLPFEDAIAFRADYEARWRWAWDQGEPGPAKALVLHLRSSEPGDLPWDYLRQARLVRLSLANLFPRLSYGVVHRLGVEYREALFEAHAKHASQSLGETATKELILTHIFQLGPHLISGNVDLWRELLRLHFRNTPLPTLLADHVESILAPKPAFAGLPISEMFASQATFLRVVQAAWERFLKGKGIAGSRVAEPPSPEYFGDPEGKIEIPFEHPDVRALIDSMFLDGTLHPLLVQKVPADGPDWLTVGIVRDPAARRNLVRDGLKRLLDTLPSIEASYRDWLSFAKSFGEILSRLHALDQAHAQGLDDLLQKVQQRSDELLVSWMRKHYSDLPSLPVATAPVMLHQVPRFLALRRGAGEKKVALLVFDGLAMDQWVQIREHVTGRAPELIFDEGACFAWLPTLTAVSRQALFAGLKPREFADSIAGTSAEPALWSRFWQDQGLRASEILYRKGIRRVDQLDTLAEALSKPSLKAAGLVVDTIDEIVHGAVLGKRGIASQIDSWCASGFVEQLFALLLDQGFYVYLTADHGNVEAIGTGRPNQGVIAESRGERVRVYSTDLLRKQSAEQIPGTIELPSPALPPEFLPLFAGGRTAFVNKGEPLVAHGGISVEELIVPFVEVNQAN
ncbi:BREX-3 system phosphatase PglZ [Thiohalocapsa sp. ML1]|uniref:BREX-3 system phosphatase PglZ n=1 Tax=Thiohalocapsa sp. ML1 TaxID=1431688 RepID=UPI000731EF7C|nr:BREX-3 system phosphatase PglZ [Thiohalocapsa sp. ML1]